ncbi:hepatic lectin-like [Patiria miniata]|uniref:C-type lectin domain-containing protein n=1 Tax=Patiria miniata TaxID=46514 RepID=A0A914AF09_PATMI|nr:hepatic lectin-like [Patiria miniata]
MVYTGGMMCKPSIGGRRGACPSTWIQWGGKCYKAAMKPLTWSEAKDECTKMGSVLVVPQSQEEADFLLLLEPIPSEFWINCSDLEEGTWKCQDGTDEVEFRNWADKQPDYANSNEHCAEVWPEGKWNDLPCHYPRLGICVRPAPQLYF